MRADFAPYSSADMIYAIGQSCKIVRRVWPFAQPSNKRDSIRPEHFQGHLSTPALGFGLRKPWTSASPRMALDSDSRPSTHWHNSGSHNHRHPTTQTTMHFSTPTFAYLASALVLALLPQAAHAGITAFSGSTCNGAAGLNVPCDGSCHQFSDRHSFRVDSGSGGHCVTMFEDAGCPAGAEVLHLLFEQHLLGISSIRFTRAANKQSWSKAVGERV
ncbi:hypothetical protein VTO73DRAFT_4065 [Trametes versicolor]